MDRFYLIGPGYTDEPTFFKLLVKYFPDATTFYAEGPSIFGEGLSIPKDIAACYFKHMKKGEHLPHKGEPPIYSLSFSQELMEELAILSEKHCSLEYLCSIDLNKESDYLLRWDDAFLHGSPVEISGIIPEEVVSKFASELGWKYRVIIEDDDLGHWSDSPKGREKIPHDHSCPSGPQIPHLIHKFEDGLEEDAFFGLLDMGPEIIPELVQLFKRGKDNRLRAFLLNVIYEFRQPNVIPFLGEALFDPEPLIWKTGLDGLVALACPEAIEFLRSARIRAFPKKNQAEEFQRWLEEAIEQAEEEIKRTQEEQQSPAIGGTEQTSEKQQK